MFYLILANVLTAYTLNMNGLGFDADQYCADVVELHEIDLDHAIEATSGLVEVDQCF